MTRITPVSVLDAYLNTDIKPICKGWAITLEDGTKCGCAITALGYSRGMDFKSILLADEREDTAHFMADGLKLNIDYVVGFIYGYDKLPNDGSYSWLASAQKELRNKGYEDGKATRKLIDEHFGVVPVHAEVEEDLEAELYE